VLADYLKKSPSKFNLLAACLLLLLLLLLDFIAISRCLMLLKNEEILKINTAKNLHTILQLIFLVAIWYSLYNK